MGQVVALSGAGVGLESVRKVLVIPHFLSFTFEKLVFDKFLLRDVLKVCANGKPSPAPHVYSSLDVSIQPVGFLCFWLKY